MERTQWEHWILDGDRYLKQSRNTASVLVTKEMAFGFAARAMEKYLAAFLSANGQPVTPDAGLDKLLYMAGYLVTRQSVLETPLRFVRLYQSHARRVLQMLRKPFVHNLESLVKTALGIRFFIMRNLGRARVEYGASFYHTMLKAS